MATNNLNSLTHILVSILILSSHSKQYMQCRQLKRHLF